MERLRKLRQGRNLTIAELSKELKKNGFAISPSSIMKYERGEREPKIDKIQAFSDFFNVSAEYLMGLSNNPIPINEQNPNLMHNPGVGLKFSDSPDFTDYDIVSPKINNRLLLQSIAVVLNNSDIVSDPTNRRIILERIDNCSQEEAVNVLREIFKIITTDLKIDL